MTAYCPSCGKWTDLDVTTLRCADCDLAWAEEFKAATRGDPQ